MLIMEYSWSVEGNRCIKCVVGEEMREVLLALSQKTFHTNLFNFAN
jgi:hypothetical protein